MKLAVCLAALSLVATIANSSAVEDQKERGDYDTAITQYRINRKTRETTFCSHGGYCYPTLYGTVPLNEPEKYRLEYGELDPADSKRGDLVRAHFDHPVDVKRDLVRPLRPGSIAASPPTTTAATPAAATDHSDRPEKIIIDLLKPGETGPQIKKTCTLQIDGTNVSCDLVWYIEFKDGGYSVQFNRGTGDKPVISFFGMLADPDTITIDAVQARIGDRSSSMDEYKATGQCLIGKMAAQCQAHLSDGRLFVGSIRPLLAETVGPTGRGPMIYSIGGHTCAKANQLLHNKNGVMLWISYIGGYVSASNIWISYIKEQQGEKSYPDVDTIHGADLETVANLAIAYCVRHPQEMGNTAVQEAISHFGNQP